MSTEIIQECTYLVYTNKIQITPPATQNIPVSGPTPAGGNWDSSSSRVVLPRDA